MDDQSHFQACIAGEGLLRVDLHKVNRPTLKVKHVIAKVRCPQFVRGIFIVLFKGLLRDVARQVELAVCQDKLRVYLLDAHSDCLLELLVQLQRVSTTGQEVDQE